MKDVTNDIQTKKPESNAEGIAPAFDNPGVAPERKRWLFEKLRGQNVAETPEETGLRRHMTERCTSDVLEARYGVKTVEARFLDNDEFENHYAQETGKECPPGLQGFYNHADRSIAVRDYCFSLETAIHEKLHDASHEDLRKLPAPLTEGMTQHLTEGAYQGMPSTRLVTDERGSYVIKGETYGPEADIVKMIGAGVYPKTIEGAYFGGNIGDLAKETDAYFGEGTFVTVVDKLRVGKAEEAREYLIEQGKTANKRYHSL